METASFPLYPPHIKNAFFSIGITPIVPKDKLFYLMSRGLSKYEAQKLIIRAGFNEIIENIKNQEIKEFIIKEIDKKLI